MASQKRELNRRKSVGFALEEEEVGEVEGLLGEELGAGGSGGEGGVGEHAGEEAGGDVEAGEVEGRVQGGRA
jgi:hypothetical protein